MTRPLLRSVLCTASLLCVSALTVRADEVKATPPLSTQPTISLLATPATSPADVATFLKTPVSFTLKDASFLGALDAVMTASGKTCPLECRQVKPMKLSFGIKKGIAGNVLDALARAGGCTLYVLPDKLLAAPASLLTAEEKNKARPFTMLVSAATLPAGKTLPRQANGFDVLAVANKKISVSVEGKALGNAMDDVTGSAMGGTVTFVSGQERPPFDRMALGGYIPTSMSLSFDQVPLGDALSVVAELGGCQLYLLPDRFLICGEGELLTPQERQDAIPALQSGLPFNPLAPSAPGA